MNPEKCFYQLCRNHMFWASKLNFVVFLVFTEAGDYKLSDFGFLASALQKFDLKMCFWTEKVVMCFCNHIQTLQFSGSSATHGQTQF